MLNNKKTIKKHIVVPDLFEVFAEISVSYCIFSKLALKKYILSVLPASCSQCPGLLPWERLKAGHFS